MRGTAKNALLRRLGNAVWRDTKDIHVKIDLDYSYGTGGDDEMEYGTTLSA